MQCNRFHDGRLRFSYKERVLTCTAYGSYAVPDPAEDEKTLDARVDAIAAARRHSGHAVAAPSRLSLFDPAGPQCAMVLTAGKVRCSPSSPCSRASARCAWLRAAALLPSPPLRAMALDVPGRDGKAGSFSRTGKLD